MGIRFATSLLLLCSVCLSTPYAQPAPAEAAAPRLGFVLPTLDALPASEDPADRPLPVLVHARWAAVEQTPGSYDWAAVESAVDALIRRGFRPVVDLTGPLPDHAGTDGLPAPLAGDSLARWEAFARAAVGLLVDRVELFQIWGDAAAGGGSVAPPETYAFLLKSTALAIRAEASARGRSIRIAQASLAPGQLEWQRSVWRREAAAYVDVLPVLVPPAADAAGTASWLAEVQAQNLSHPPAAAVWALVARRAEPQAAGLAVASLAAGATTALIELDPQAGDLVRWGLGADRLLATGFAPAPAGQVRFEDANGSPIAGARAFARFFSDQDFATLIFYVAPGTIAEFPDDRMIVESAFARDGRWIDVVSGREIRVGSSPAPQGEGGRSIRIGRTDLPRALRYRTAPVSPGFELPPEEVETARTRELTAEEIIARYQGLQQIQDDRLERWSADGQIDFHFKLAQGTATVDVRIESRYFWERGRELEWEQTRYFLNGNLVRWKNIPELPLIQPEKVVTAPLDLTFDKTYSYRLVGRDRIDDTEAWILAFQPADPDPSRSLYRGRVWISTEDFHRMRVSVIQTGLEPPVVSNEEVTDYGPVDGPDGETYWMPLRTQGQQVWKTAGRNFVVRRESELQTIRINPQRAEFEEDRQRAYASNNQMLRDTDEGLRYLERQEDGSRQVKQQMDTSQIFLGAGAFRDGSTDGVQPLGGVNYFNYDFRRKDIQINAFFAGVLGFFTASDPAFLGNKIDATVDATLSAIKFDDKVFSGDDELLLERLETRSQNVALQLGRPLGAFGKLTLRGGVSFRSYFEEDDARDAIDAFNATPGGTRMLEFRRPPDHQLYTGRIRGEFNRRGYSLLGSVTWGRRSDWEEFGLFDTLGGSYVEFDPVSRTLVDVAPPEVEQSFTRWQMTAFKEWYLPAFQKLRGEINYLDGSSLDRFSRYEFSLFGDDRLNGFSGSGVRFDRGFLARAGYSFNLFEALRLDAVLETARVEQKDSIDGMQSFSGVGLAGNVLGPWKTVISLSYGYALSSDIPDLEGEHEFLLLILKLF